MLKHLNAIEDYQGKVARLKSFRTRDKKEVDFVLVVDHKPVQIIEVKLSDPQISPTLRYFHKKYAFPAVQLVKNLRQERLDSGIEVRRAFNYLNELVL